MKPVVQCNQGWALKDRVSFGFSTVESYRFFKPCTCIDIASESLKHCKSDYTFTNVIAKSADVEQEGGDRSLPGAGNPDKSGNIGDRMRYVHRVVRRFFSGSILCAEHIDECIV